MKVFILYIADNEGNNVVAGVFSTYDKAQDAADNNSYRIGWYSIEPVVMNEVNDVL